MEKKLRKLRRDEGGGEIEGNRRARKKSWRIQKRERKEEKKY